MGGYWSDPMTEPGPYRSSRAWRRIVIAAAIYLALTCVLTWPLVTSLGTRLAGALGSDVFGHVWMHWISRHALLESGMLPFRIETDLLLAPLSGKVHSSDPVGSLLSVPLQALFGLVASFNLIILANVTFSATAMFVLARRATKDDRAAFVAGLAFGFSPFLLAEVNNGAPELLTAGWLPLLVLTLSRLSSTRGWTHVLPTAAVLWMASISTWYYGVCACLLVAVSCLSPPVLHEAPPVPLRDRLRKHLAVTVVFAIAIAPFTALYVDSMAGADALVYGDAAHKEHALEQAHLSVDAKGVLLPFRSHYQIVDFLLPSYLGLVVLGLAAAGAATRRPGRRFWLAGGGAALVLAMGPILVFGSRHIEVGGHPVWMPFALFSEVLPILSSMHTPRRMLVVTIMAVALLGGVGVKALMTSVPPRWATAVACACGLLVLAEPFLTRQVPFPIPSTSAAVAPVFETIARSPRKGALLEAPVLLDDNRLVIFYTQTVHGRPIQAGLPWEGPVASYCAPPVREVPLVQWLAVPGVAGGDNEPPATWTVEGVWRDLEWLEAMGFSHILLHTSEFTPDRARAAGDLLDRLIGPGDRSSPSFILYTLPSPARTKP